MEKIASCHLSFFVGILFRARSRGSPLRRELTPNPLLNHPMKYFQDLMLDWG